MHGPASSNESQEELPYEIFSYFAKPNIERRAKAMYEKQWFGGYVTLRITVPRHTFETYCKSDQTAGEVIALMVGGLGRIVRYSKLGYQTK